MPKPIRFFYVGAPSSKALVHRSFAPHFVEGERTDCGMHFRIGWRYWLGKRNVPKERTLCSRCFE